MVVALIAALAPEHWSVKPPEAVAFAGVFIAWLLAELRSAVIKHPHDVRLMEEFLKKVTQGERMTLRDDDLGNSFRSSEFAGVFDVALRWVGPEFEFLDPVIQKAWKPARAAIGTFRDEVAARTQPVPERGDWLTVKTGREMAAGLERSQRAIDDAKVLNDAASTVTKALDSFVPTAKRRLGL
jgi:hypothetical protein